MNGAPIVRHNDWTTIDVPDLATWTPTATVSVVIPAHECAASLALTLASLAVQTYPADLLEVIVVDDGSDPPLVLPAIRPRRCRIVRTPPGSRGIAKAVNLGVRESTGSVIHRLDADMIVHPDHVATMARWHIAVPYAVVLGGKRFVDVSPESPGWPAPEVVADPTAFAKLFDVATSLPHPFVDDLVTRTDGLRRADHLAFMATVGATISVSRGMWDAVAGLDPGLRMGEDTEFGYRLTQAGAVFIPEARAHAWHLGQTHMMRDGTRLRRSNRPHLADRMPQPRWLRKTGGSSWTVPLAVVNVDVADQPLERVRTVVDAVLRGDETDLRVDLVGPWCDSAPEADRAESPDAAGLRVDTDTDLQLLAATYRSDPRVRLVERMCDAFPSPYLVIVPSTGVLASDAIRRLIAEADRHQAGLVAVAGTGVEAWRTAALGRAKWVAGGSDGGTSNDPSSQGTSWRARPGTLASVEATHGVRSVNATDVGVLDIGTMPVDRLVEGLDGAVGDVRGGRWLPATVEVGGLRTLALASVVAARSTAIRLLNRVRVNRLR